MRPSIEGLQQLNIIFTQKRYFLSLDLYMKKHYNCNLLVLYGIHRVIKVPFTHH